MFVTRRIVLGLAAVLALPAAAIADCAVTDTGPASVLHVVRAADPDARDAAARIVAARLAETDVSGTIQVRAMDRDGIVVVVPQTVATGRLFLPGAFGFHRVTGDGTVAGPGEVAVATADGTQSVIVEASPFVDSWMIEDASAGLDPGIGQPVVNFRLDADGARAFAEYTGAHIGERVAIVVDGELLTAPVIREPIVGGSGVITGLFTIEEATELAIVLRVGPLPAPLERLAEIGVGPFKRTAATAEPGVMVELAPDAAPPAEEICAAMAILADDATIQSLADGGRLLWLAAPNAAAADAIVAALRQGAAGSLPRRVARVGPDLSAGTGGVLKRLKRLLD